MELRILLLNPNEEAREAMIEDSVPAIQNVVGGLFQAVYPFDDPVALVCNDEGKLLGLQPNRALRDKRGEIYDIICGPAFIVGLGDESFCSLSDDMVEKYAALFKKPESFVFIGGRIFSV